MLVMPPVLEAASVISFPQQAGIQVTAVEQHQEFPLLFVNPSFL
jgi:hypothetical protein